STRATRGPTPTTRAAAAALAATVAPPEAATEAATTATTPASTVVVAAPGAVAGAAVPAPAAQAGPTSSSDRAWRTGALVALGALVLFHLALAVLFAAAGSRVVPATAGGSPDWLVGPFRGRGPGAGARG